MPIITAKELRRFKPPPKNRQKLRVVDSHEFIDLYRGDKDLRVGKILCRDYDCEFVQLGSDIPSPADSRFFSTKDYPVERIGNLPDSYFLLLLKSRIIFHRRGNISLGGFFRWAPGIALEAYRWRPDIIIEVPYLTLSPRSYMTSWAAQKLRIPLVYIDCGDILSKVSLKHKLSLIFEKPIVNRAAAIITYNEAGKKRFINKYGYPPEKIHVIPKPIDTGKFRPDIDCRDFKTQYGLNDKFVVAYFGRICKNKGAHHLLEAASIINRRNAGKDIVFLFVGGSIDLSHEAFFIDKMSDLPLDNIKLTGPIMNDDMPEAYAAVDLAVFPDLTNLPAFPTVLAESMAAGLPSIIGIRGWEDAIPIRDHFNGLITKAGDAEELALKIIELKNNIELRKNIHTNVLRFAREEMDYDKVVAKYFELFSRLTGKGRNVESPRNEYQTQTT